MTASTDSGAGNQSNKRPGAPREVRSTFYLTVIVVAAVIAGSVWIGSAINLRGPNVAHTMPLTRKTVARSVARVAEARLSEARLRILMARKAADAKPSTKAKPGNEKAQARPTPEQLALAKIQKDPTSRQEPRGDAKAGETTEEDASESTADTTPEGYLVDRVDAERVHLVRQLAALVPARALVSLGAPCRDDTQTDCLRGDATKDDEVLRAAIVNAIPESGVGSVVKAWTDQVGSDVAVQQAWELTELPGTASGFLRGALAGEAATKPDPQPAEMGREVEEAIARQMALDAAFLTLPATEADWAAKDIGGRLGWATVAVIVIGLWAAVASVALYIIATFRSKTAVGVAVAAAAAAGLLIALVQSARPGSFELFGQLLRLLEDDRGTSIAEASRVLNCLVAASLVLLLAAARAILRRERPGQPLAAGSTEDPSTKADLTNRLESFKTLFNTGALFLAAAAFEVATLFSWPGSVFDGASDAPASLKAAALLGGGFVGALFSTVLILVYVPTQSVLRDWVRRELPESGPALLTETGLSDTTSQQFLRLLQAAAPMLAGLPATGLISLLG
jgi:hypothetical protein